MLFDLIIFHVFVIYILSLTELIENYSDKHPIPVIGSSNYSAFESLPQPSFRHPPEPAVN